jgi:hypothetical protein
MLKNAFVAVVAVGALASSSAAAPEEIVVIVNKDNDVTELSPEQLEAIFAMSQRQWRGGSTIVAFNYEPGNEIRVEFDRVVLHLSPEEVGRFWRDQRIRTGVHPPRQVLDAALMLRLTAKLNAAIAYVPAAAVTPSVKIVARIRGGKVVAPSRAKGVSHSDDRTSDMKEAQTKAAKAPVGRIAVVTAPQLAAVVGGHDGTMKRPSH